ncbi:hypothetical protein AOLI_G00249230 [Acnodon oligacanthus]
MSSQKTRESECCAFIAPQPQEADQHRSEMKGTDLGRVTRTAMLPLTEQSAELWEVNPATFQVMRRGTPQAARQKPLSLQRRGLRWDEPGYLFIRMT